mmetsp:Transcript_6654/g.23339  ORF Transcript_6654/g.23339 Transcript_6654/m.23339 type:complete len:523 (+) Transcript_6654:143-1711(+)
MVAVLVQRDRVRAWQLRAIDRCDAVASGRAVAAKGQVRGESEESIELGRARRRCLGPGRYALDGRGHDARVGDGVRRSAGPFRVDVVEEPPRLVDAGPRRAVGGRQVRRAERDKGLARGRRLLGLAEPGARDPPADGVREDGVFAGLAAVGLFHAADGGGDGVVVKRQRLLRLELTLPVRLCEDAPRDCEPVEEAQVADVDRVAITPQRRLKRDVVRRPSELRRAQDDGPFGAAAVQLLLGPLGPDPLLLLAVGDGDAVLHGGDCYLLEDEKSALVAARDSDAQLGVECRRLQPPDGAVAEERKRDRVGQYDAAAPDCVEDESSPLEAERQAVALHFLLQVGSDDEGAARRSDGKLDDVVEPRIGDRRSQSQLLLQRRDKRRAGEERLHGRRPVAADIAPPALHGENRHRVGIRRAGVAARPRRQRRQQLPPPGDVGPRRRRRGHLKGFHRGSELRGLGVGEFLAAPGRRFARDKVREPRPGRRQRRGCGCVADDSAPRHGQAPARFEAPGERDENSDAHLA